MHGSLLRIAEVAFQFRHSEFSPCLLASTLAGLPCVAAFRPWQPASATARQKTSRPGGFPALSFCGAPSQKPPQPLLLLSPACKVATHLDHDLNWHQRDNDDICSEGPRKHDEEGEAKQAQHLILGYPWYWHPTYPYP